MVKIVVLDAFCWFKNTKIDFSRGLASDPTGLTKVVFLTPTRT